MYCSNCGEKLIDVDQKFCHNCGAGIFSTPKPVEYKSEKIQSVPAPKMYNTPVKQQLQLQRGLPGKYSRLCLWFALASIFIGFISLIIGYVFYRYYYFPYYNIILRVVVSILMLIMRSGGLVLGVFSKVNSSKAQIFEPYNDSEKAGSIFAIFGIIVNAIGIFLSFFGPWSILSFPY
jgi:hypothetical protein